MYAHLQLWKLFNVLNEKGFAPSKVNVIRPPRVGLILHIITETDSLRALMSDRKGAKFVKKL